MTPGWAAELYSPADSVRLGMRHLHDMGNNLSKSFLASQNQVFGKILVNDISSTNAQNFKDSSVDETQEVDKRFLMWHRSIS